MPSSLYHKSGHETRWYSFPAYKPMKRGRYLVTFRRPVAGKWISICRWNGDAWERLPEGPEKERLHGREQN